VRAERRDEERDARGQRGDRAPAAGGAALKSVEFRAERESAWRDLERLLDRASRTGLAGLAPAELFQLPLLYRQALSSLSVARAISLDKNLVTYLEGLAARAYVAVHGARRPRRGALARFAGRGFPAAVRALATHLAVAALVLLLGGLAGYAVCAADPSRFESLVGGMAQGRNPDASTAELREPLYGTGEGGELAVFSAFLFHHNASIGILCFALGFAAGLPVFLLVVTNGLVLGAFAWLYHGRGLGPELWAWMLPHGVTELLAICLFAAAGLALAQGFLFPGRLRRLDSLALAGRTAGRVVVGAIAMMLLAGFVEGFFRQLVHHPAIRYSVATLSAAGWGAYLGLAGRAAEAGAGGEARRPAEGAA